MRDIKEVLREVEVVLAHYCVTDFDDFFGFIEIDMTEEEYIEFKEILEFILDISKVIILSTLNYDYDTNICSFQYTNEALELIRVEV